jgi:predicted ATP-binding protein involved in virulence
LKENTWQWYRWRKGIISNEEMWKICRKFEEDMEKAGIKGQSITGAFDANMFSEEIWTYYDVEKWFPEEKGMRRFKVNGEENLDEVEIMKQWKKKKGR